MDRNCCLESLICVWDDEGKEVCVVLVGRVVLVAFVQFVVALEEEEEENLRFQRDSVSNIITYRGKENKE